MSRRKPMNNVIAEWTEVDNTYFIDGPPKRKDYEVVLLLNRAQVRQLKAGLCLFRKRDVESFNVRSRKEISKKIAEFVMRDDVRLLAEEVQGNQLPREDRHPLEDVISGTASIYNSAKGKLSLSEKEPARLKPRMGTGRSQIQ